MSSQPTPTSRGDEGREAEGDLEELGLFLFGNQEKMDTKNALQVPHLLVLAVLAAVLHLWDTWAARVMALAGAGEERAAAASTLMGVTREETKLDPH